VSRVSISTEPAVRASTSRVICSPECALRQEIVHGEPQAHHGTYRVPNSEFKVYEPSMEFADITPPLWR
jgi:hypothetical protein